MNSLPQIVGRLRLRSTYFYVIFLFALGAELTFAQTKGFFPSEIQMSFGSISYHYQSIEDEMGRVADSAGLSNVPIPFDHLGKDIRLGLSVDFDLSKACSAGLSLSGFRTSGYHSTPWPGDSKSVVMELEYQLREFIVGPHIRYSIGLGNSGVELYGKASIAAAFVNMRKDVNLTTVLISGDPNNNIPSYILGFHVRGEYASIVPEGALTIGLKVRIFQACSISAEYSFARTNGTSVGGSFSPVENSILWDIPAFRQNFFQEEKFDRHGSSLSLSLTFQLAS